MTKTKTDATPCTNMRYTGMCGSTRLRYNERHVWCASCGIKRKLEKTRVRRMVYEFHYLTDDTEYAHNHIASVMNELGVASFSQLKIEDA